MGTGSVRSGFGVGGRGHTGNTQPRLRHPQWVVIPVRRGVLTPLIRSGIELQTTGDKFIFLMLGEQV